MTVEIISWSISTKVWYWAGIELATPGSAVRHASVAKHVTDCATRPGETVELENHKCYRFSTVGIISIRTPFTHTHTHTHTHPSWKILVSFGINNQTPSVKIVEDFFVSQAWTLKNIFGSAQWGLKKYAIWYIGTKVTKVRPSQGVPILLTPAPLIGLSPPLHKVSYDPYSQNF